MNQTLLKSENFNVFNDTKPTTTKMISKMNSPELTSEQLKTLETKLAAAYETLKQENLALDLTRGKPSTSQVSITDSLDGILNGNYISDSGIDTRNYGHLRGLPESCKLGGEILETPASQVITGGNASLSLMHSVVLLHYLYGYNSQAWQQLVKPTFICPVPGYDRHFSICENLGIEMITVPMTVTGPDMDTVEDLLKTHPNIVGMWCVPKYSNPTGSSYSDETVERIAKLGNIAQPYFRVLWDNAYAIHTLEEPPKKLANIWHACQENGTEDSVWQFASTSKVSFAGSGISWVASSDSNLQAFEKLLSVTTIGSDKVNQLRHHRLFPNKKVLTSHMQKHAHIIKAKFEIVLNTLNDELHHYGHWTEAKGGYFISFDSQAGLAKIIVKLASEVGLKLTPAGATFPYGKDPEDCNIRIAPTFPSVEELEKAMEIFTVCVKLATVRKHLH